jgi:hypothetical protein
MSEREDYSTPVLTVYPSLTDVTGASAEPLVD